MCGVRLDLLSQLRVVVDAARGGGGLIPRTSSAGLRQTRSIVLLMLTSGGTSRRAGQKIRGEYDNPDQINDDGDSGLGTEKA